MSKSFLHIISIKSAIIVLALMFFNLQLFAQDDKKEVAGKTAARIGLSSTQLNGDSILLQTAVKTKREGSLQAIEFEWIKFFAINDSVTTDLGKALTDDKGVASKKVGINQLVAGADGLWMIGSSFEGNDLVEAGEADLSVKKAGMVLVAQKQDSVNVLSLRLFNPENDSPIAEADVKFYVKRHFSNLEIGEGTTDENGEVSIECPQDLNGDEEGNIILIAKAEDMEEYGSVSVVKVEPWGIALPEVATKTTRTLWSQEPPLWMFITFIVLMSIVWGHYFVIIFNLVKIKNHKIPNQ